MYGVVWTARTVARRPMSGVFRRHRLTWHLDLNEGIDFSIYSIGTFEPATIRHYARNIRPGSVVIDIGANIGAHTLPLADIVGSSGSILAIEATEYAYAKLLRNIQLNPGLASRVRTFHTLLIESASSVLPPTEITSSWPLVGSTNDKVLEGGATKTVGRARHQTLDDLVEEVQLSAVDWIKVDVDGNETTVLKGGIQTLRKFKPKIMIEFAPYCHASGSFEALIQLLVSIGYHFSRIPSGEPLPSTSTELQKIIPHRGSINVLATAHSEDSSLKSLET